MMNEFLMYLEEQAANHSIYIWGGQGQSWPTVTEAWIKTKESGTNRTRALATYRAAVKGGFQKLLRAFDCSGLGAYWLYNKMQLISGDKNANGLMGMCTLIQKSHVKKGDWVFKRYTTGTKRAYHVGYVVDDALNVIEARGRAYGVVKRPLSAGGWNAYGRPTLFAAEIDTPEEVAEHMAFNRQLKEGMRGDDVRELQRLLNAAGDNIAADGAFGSKTQAAVRAFQKRWGLKIDGVAGRDTITALGGVWEVDKPLSEITVCTFNTKRGFNKSANHRKIAELIAGCDIVGLQEITASNVKTMAGKLAYSQCKTVGNYGTAICHKPARVNEKIYTLPRGGELRKLHVMGFNGVSFYNAHCHYTDPPRTKQLAEILRIMQADPLKTQILTGDFNCEPRELEIFSRAGYMVINRGQSLPVVGGGTGTCYQLDNIIVRGCGVLDVWMAKTIAAGISDHDALFAKVKI